MNKKVALISGLTIVGLVGVFTMFSGNEDKGNQNAGETIEIVHPAGTSEVTKNPEKVVVFDYAALDAIQALEIDGVVGVPQSSSIPEYLSEYKSDEYGNVGGLKEPDLEKINELQPDLIIINGRQHSFYDQLTEIAPTVSFSKEDGQYMRDFTKNMNIIGDVFGKEDQVKDELARIDTKIDEINKTVTEKDLYATTLMASDGALSVFGADSRFSMIYNDLGFKNTDENVTSADHGQDVSFEYVASQDSDYMLVVDKSVIMTDAEGQTPAQELLDNELINNTKAAKEGNVVYLDTHAWYLSDGGIISTNEMIDEIAEALEK